MATERKNKESFIRLAHMAAEGGCCWPHLLTFLQHPLPGNNQPTCSTACDPSIPERTREASATQPGKGEFHLCVGERVHLRSHCLITSCPVTFSYVFLLHFLEPSLAYIISLKSLFHCLFLTSEEIISLNEFSRRQILITIHCKQRLGKNEGLRGLYPPEDNDPKSLVIWAALLKLPGY